MAPFRILALSGGGYQGLFTAQVLAAIEAAGPGRLRDRYDLIAGTSIGGIIALAIAAGVPARRIVDTFLEAGPALFPNGPVRGGRLSAARDALRFLTRPKYDPAPLRDLIRAFPRPDLRLSDLPLDVLIPATRVSDGDPVLFSRVHHGGLRLIDVALATSAAPMMFPTHRIDAEVSEGEGARIGLDVATPEARALIGRISARTISALEACCPPHWGGPAL